jgi:hypothetical protein
MLKGELESIQKHSPIGDLVYLRPGQVPRRYPISRSLVYELLGAGQIRSISLRKPGGVRGIRLIPVDSIECHLSKLAAEQKSEKLVPVIAREDERVVMKLVKGAQNKAVNRHTSHRQAPQKTHH